MRWHGRRELRDEEGKVNGNTELGIVLSLVRSIINPLVPRVQRMKFVNLFVTLRAQFVKEIVYFNAH